MDHKLSMNALIFALAMGAVVCFGAFVLYGAWVEKHDGRRQNLREHGVRPTMGSNGSVHGSDLEKEGEDQDGDQRS